MEISYQVAHSAQPVSVPDEDMRRLVIGLGDLPKWIHVVRKAPTRTRRKVHWSPILQRLRCRVSRSCVHTCTVEGRE